MHSFRLGILGVSIVVVLPLLAFAETSCPQLTKNLSFGSRGADVVRLQQYLISQHFLDADSTTGLDGLTPSGYFGRLTEAAVQQWQSSHGVASSGTAATNGFGAVGPKTRAALAAACSGGGTSVPWTSSGQANPNQSLINSLLAQVKVLQDKLAQLIAARSGGGGGGGSGGGGGGSGATVTTTTTASSCTWNGSTLASGSSVTAYQSLNVAYGSQCVSETRTCTNGTLSGSYQYLSCTVGGVTPPPPTPAPTVTLSANPTSITSGNSSTLTWSSTNATPCTASGSWTGAKATSGTQSVSPTATATYTLTCAGAGGTTSRSATVTVTQPAAACTFNGQTVASGSSVTAYQASSVPAGQTCVSQTRICTNGTLSGSYAYASCTVTPSTTRSASLDEYAAKKLPTVGAIRWDFWSTPNQANYFIRGLAPSQWRYRLPFFATVSATGTVRVLGDTQAVVDQEIMYAYTHGVDYWAFCYYPGVASLSYGLNYYRSSPNKHLLNFALITGGALFRKYNTDQWTTEFGKVIEMLREPTYQKTIDGRPIIFIFGASNLASAAGGEAQGRELVLQMRQTIVDAGLPNPYFVNLQSWERDWTDKLGLDAGSSYTIHGNAIGGSYTALANGSPYFWNLEKKEGHALIPPVNVGWDPRPIYEHPQDMYPLPAIQSWYAVPTRQEAANNIFSGLDWARDAKETALDRSGFERHGTMIGSPAYGGGKIGSTILLDGVNDYVTMGDQDGLEGLPQMSVAFWGKFDNLGSTPITPVAKSSAYRFTVNAGGLAFVVATKDNAWYSTGTFAQWKQPLVKGRWYHVVGVYDGTRVQLYVDGALVQSGAATLSGSIVSNTNPFVIGQKSADNVALTKGAIDDARVYNRALTAAEIQALASQSLSVALPASVSSGLIGYWNLDTPPNSIVVYSWNEYAEGGNTLSPRLDGTMDSLRAVEDAKVRLLQQ